MMKKTLLAGLLIGTLPLSAEILQFDLSPDAATPGLSPANEVPPVAGTGSGGEILSGITYDTDTNLLSIPLGYGSFAGFTDLTGAVTAAHIHGPAAVTGNAPPIHDFIANGQHIAAPNPAAGGVIIGSATLSAANETHLLNGQLYVNIHTAANPGGELRGQLIEVTNVAPTVVCPQSVELECPGAGTPVELVARVEDADGDTLFVTWTLNGDVQDPIEVLPDGGITAADVMLTAELELGENTVLVEVTDGENTTVSCEATITIVDTTAPEILSVVATPDTLWPPNGKMKTVNVTVEAEDSCGEVTWEIISVTSSDPNGHNDTEIVDEDTVLLRASRSGKNKDGRTYTITVEATDESGNTATETVEVTVPHDQRNNRHKNIRR